MPVFIQDATEVCETLQASQSNEIHMGNWEKHLCSMNKLQMQVTIYLYVSWQ